jgi:hypothetical protein
MTTVCLISSKAKMNFLGTEHVLLHRGDQINLGRPCVRSKTFSSNLLPRRSLVQYSRCLETCSSWRARTNRQIVRSNRSASTSRMPNDWNTTRPEKSCTAWKPNTATNSSRRAKTSRTRTRMMNRRVSRKTRLGSLLLPSWMPRYGRQ